MRIIIGSCLTAVAALYALLAAIVMWRSRRPAPEPDSSTGEAREHAQGPPPPYAELPAVSVLKPLCGAEVDLYEQLRSFCTQQYRACQVLFGVREAGDPAVEVVRRLQQEFPQRELTLIVDPTLHGCNNKVSNLINMLPHARHGWLLFADSDITAPPDYLAQVLVPLSDPRVGLVTCPYVGRTAGGLPAELGTMFINDWFMPSVQLAAAFGSQGYVSGATIAMRREVLEAIGGLQPLADQLADDHRLGELVRRRGLSVVLSRTHVYTTVSEQSLRALCRHELRWLRTVQSVQPLGYALCFPSFPLVSALLGAAIAGFAPPALGLLGITGAARLMLHYFAGNGGAGMRWKQLGLLPLREALLAALWAWSFSRREIVWREQRFGIGQDGSLYRVG